MGLAKGRGLSLLNNGSLESLMEIDKISAVISNSRSYGPVNLDFELLTKSNFEFTERLRNSWSFKYEQSYPKFGEAKIFLHREGVGNERCGLIEITIDYFDRKIIEINAPFKDFISAVFLEELKGIPLIDLVRSEYRLPEPTQEMREEVLSRFPGIKLLDIDQKQQRNKIPNSNDSGDKVLNEPWNPLHLSTNTLPNFIPEPTFEGLLTARRTLVHSEGYQEIGVLKTREDIYGQMLALAGVREGYNHFSKIKLDGDQPKLTLEEAIRYCKELDPDCEFRVTFGFENGVLYRDAATLFVKSRKGRFLKAQPNAWTPKEVKETRNFEDSPYVPIFGREMPIIWQEEPEGYEPLREIISGPLTKYFEIIENFGRKKYLQKPNKQN